MKFSLENKTAIVTGGGSGIGKAISTTFAEMGATVCIFEMNMEAGNQTVSEIKEKGQNALCLKCDVSNQAEVNAAFEAIASKGYNVDILINNAGIAHVGNIEKTTTADMDRL